MSTEEQAEKGFSLDAQEKLCRDFAERNGFNVIGVHRDEGKSATNLDRPALQEMLSKCTVRDSISAVIVQETDRLARNTKDHLTIKAVLKKADVKLISVAQPMLDDSPEGMMIDTILASVNQFQSDINSRKTKRGIKEKLDLGWWPGWAPLGYVNAAIEATVDGGKTVKIINRDPAKWDMIREGFDLYLTGNYSADRINDILYTKGLRSKYGKKIPHSIMVKTLSNPFYAGIISWNGQQYEGRHERMISKDEHQRVLRIMAEHNLHACRKRKHSFLLRGMAYCNICGHRYTAEIHRAKKKAYYHCAAMRTHTNRYQNIETLILEREVEKWFKTIQFSEEYTERIISGLRKFYGDRKKSTSSQKQALYNQKKAIETRRNKAEEKLFDGILSDEDFIRLRTKFTAELAQINGQIEKLDAQEEVDIDFIQEVLKLSRNIYRAYVEAGYELKRQYLGMFWDRFLVQDRKIVKAVPTELVLALQREQKVIINEGWLPSPPLIITLQNHEHITGLKARFSQLCHNLTDNKSRFGYVCE